MNLYLKGYYGYQNFGDEMLLFGAIEKIFTDYAVDKLVIEVGDLAWIQQRKAKNQIFIDAYYHSHGVAVDWEKIQFFQPHQWSQHLLSKWLQRWIPQKWATYFLFFLGCHPYRSFFKIFGGGEVIDETRIFPHNGWNIPLLYLRSLIKKNFALRGGFGSQKKWTTRFLSSFLFTSANNIVARDLISYRIAKKKNTTVEKIQDLSTGILEYFSHCDLDEEKTGSSYGILNCSPLTLLDSKVLQENLVTPLQWRYFASDRVYDYPFFPQLRDTYQLKEYDWTDKNLAEILSFIKKSEIGIGSRLHFLYCFNIFGLPYHLLHQSQKLKSLVSRH